jgi:hypothetical protein
MHGGVHLLRQRVYGLLAGYEDANDAARLRTEPVFHWALGRQLDEGEALASQPTLSRFENAQAPRALLRWGLELLNFTIERQQSRHPHTHTITLDLDPTDDPAYGQQLFSEFNGYYDERCYLPLLAFGTWHDEHGKEEPERHLLAALLRPGNAPATRGLRFVLHHCVQQLRRAHPGVRLRVRLDGAYATPEVLQWLEEQGLEYVVNLPANPVLLRLTTDLLALARLEAYVTGQSAQRFGEFQYQAGTWEAPRRVVVKAEATVDPAAPEKGVRDNPRFVVTNLRSTPEYIYRKVYCPRGAIEKEIGELKRTFALGRTSCSDFWANQYRVLLTVTAAVLLQELRAQAAGTEAERWEARSFVARLVKCAARVRQSTRRWLFQIADSFPNLALFLQLASRLAPQPSG